MVTVTGFEKQMVQCHRCRMRPCRREYQEDIEVFSLMVSLFSPARRPLPARHPRGAPPVRQEG